MLLQGGKVRVGDFLWLLIAHDRETFDHCVRVGRNLRQLVAYLDLEPVVAGHLVQAGLLHDIGKLAVPKEILTAKEPLDEFGVGEIKRHPKVGRALADILNLDETILRLIVSHHEPGYPRGQLRREDELEVLRNLLKLADKIDALKSERSYKRSFSDTECYDILLGEGFEEVLIELLLKNY